MKLIANIFRILVGLVFMFSGFVKGVDPLGFAYRLEDYFIAYNWEFMIPAALVLSIMLCTIEFSLGAMLFFKVHLKIASFFVLLMMVFFTILTLYDAIYTPVADCGCFGDAIILTNWQTFYKNLVLLPMALIVFLFRNKFRGRKARSVQWGMALLIIGLFAGFSTWCYRHLPIIDFTEWKKGNKLYAENPKPVNYYLKYKNILTGEEKEYLSPNYPYDDSTWMAQWQFVSQRVEDPNVYNGKSLMITDTLGNDFTASIIRNPDYQILVTCYDLRKANEKGIRRIIDLCNTINSTRISAVILVAAEASDINAFAEKYKTELPVYQADDIILKTMVRSNPGLLLLKNGEVIDKWHYRDVPDAADFKKRFLNN